MKKLFLNHMQMLAALAVGGILVSGCGGTQPLLTMLADEAPVQPKDGSWWQYQGLGSSPSFVRSITATAQSLGREAQSVSLSAAVLGPAGRYSGLVSIETNGLYLFDLSASPPQWTLERRLPYIVGASWSLTPGPGEDSKKIKVDGMETVIIPAGTFERCFRLVETTLDADAVPDKVERVIWVSPSVGDLQYGMIDSLGSVVIEQQLIAYSLAN